MNESPLHSAVVFALGPVPISAQVLVGSALVLVLAVAAALLARRLRVEQPSAAQLFAEWLIAMTDDLIRDVTRAPPAPYQPLITTLFVFILFSNLSTLIPGIEPPTASLETDAALAGIVFIAVIVYGVRERGLLAYLKSFAQPVWLMIPLNLIEQLTRTFSLMVRLFGNVMSGAFVIGIVASLAGLLVPIPFMALEVLTGIVQAYIFAVLATVFIGAAVSEETAAATSSTSHRGEKHER